MPNNWDILNDKNCTHDAAKFKKEVEDIDQPHLNRNRSYRKKIAWQV